MSVPKRIDMKFQERPQLTATLTAGHQHLYLSGEDHQAGKDNEPVKILLVDDVEENLVALEAILDDPRYHLIRAASGKEALKCLLKDQDFSLILMDVMMPGINGFETANLIYDRDKLKHIPIIFLTAFDLEENMYKGYDAGAVDFIKKPIVPGLLKAKVKVFVELSLKTKRLVFQEKKLRSINENLEKEILERKNKEQQITILNNDLKAKLIELQSLDSFAHTVAHDLKSPLNGIGGLSFILHKKYASQLDEQGKQMLDMIQGSIKNMNNLINCLLIFSRQANKDLVKESLDMTSMVKEVIKDLKILNPVEGLEIVLDDLHPAFGDKDMIKQVWINLISNAIKYSSKGNQPRIEIGCYAQAGKQVYFVKDNGVGFDMKNYQKLFGVFQRLHTTTEFEGSGIGLSIVKRIIEKHGGEVWAESEPGSGAKFYVML
jgi:two-component system, sensor histidine kinase and response regulator